MNLKADMLSDINQEIVESVEFLEEAEKESAALSFVNDDNKADSVLYWHGSVEAEIEAILTFKRREIERVTHYANTKIKALEKRLEFMSAALKSYNAVSNGKSVSLTNGKFGTRKTPDKVDILDGDEFLGWHKDNANGEMVKIIHQPVKKGIKEHIQTTGECPPGVEYIEGERKFYVKTYR